MNNKNAGLAVLLIAAAVGLWARLHALGASALAADEYYLLTSARNVLEHALPVFDCGGYYTRGLLHQYLTAGLMYFGLSPEVAVRLPSEAAGLGSIWGAYLLARHVGGRGVALFVAALLFLSLWQVEFARFGRMYALFQVCTVFYLLAAVKYFETGRRRYFFRMIGIGFLALSAHEGAALLTAFTMFAVLLDPKKVRPGDIGLALLVFAMAVAMTWIDFRHLGAQYPFSEQFLFSTQNPEESGYAIDLPVLPLLPAWKMILLTVAGVIGAVGLISACRRASPPAEEYFLVLRAAAWTAIVACMASGLFLLGGIVLAVSLLLGILHLRALFKPRLAGTLALCAAVFLAIWGLKALFTPGSGIQTVVRALLGYPDFYNEVFRPWVSVLPLLGGAILGISAYAGVKASMAPVTSIEAVQYRLLLGIVLTILVAAVLSNQPYNSTRYTFFLYPVLIVLLVQGAVLIWKLSAPQSPQPLLALLPVAGIFVFSNDFNFRHLLRVAEPQYLYRTAYKTPMANHLYDRWDYRSVGRYVDTHAAPDDLVATTAYPVVPHYTRQLDFVYIDRNDPRIWIVSACEGRRDIWSGLPLMYDPAELKRKIETSERTVWLVVDTERYQARRPIEAELLDRYRRHEVFRSIDGHLAVLRIPAAGGGS